MAALTSKQEKLQKQREYTRENRELWGELGFKLMSLRVHDDERKIVTAELEVRRADKMVDLVEDRRTPDKELYILSTRNLAKVPDRGDYDHLLTMAENSKQRATIHKLLDLSRYYMRKFVGVETAFTRADEASEDTRTKMLAKAVAYSAACLAYYRLSVELFHHTAPKQITVFGLREPVDND